MAIYSNLWQWQSIVCKSEWQSIERKKEVIVKRFHQTIVQLLRRHHSRSHGSCLTLHLPRGLLWIWSFLKVGSVMPFISILWTHKSFVQSCLESGHLYLMLLKFTWDALQHRASSICHCTFPSLESHWHAAVVDPTCRLLDGEGRGDLHSFLS